MNCTKGREKLKCLERVLEEWSEKDRQWYTLQNVAYIGDDILDIQCMEPVKEQGGLTACPADAVKQVKENVDYICRHMGGNGAVREVIEQLFKKRI